MKSLICSALVFCALYAGSFAEEEIICTEYAENTCVDTTKPTYCLRDNNGNLYDRPKCGETPSEVGKKLIYDHTNYPEHECQVGQSCWGQQQQAVSGCGCAVCPCGGSAGFDVINVPVPIQRPQPQCGCSVCPCSPPPLPPRPPKPPKRLVTMMRPPPAPRVFVETNRTVEVKFSNSGSDGTCGCSVCPCKSNSCKDTNSCKPKPSSCGCPGCQPCKSTLQRQRRSCGCPGCQPCYPTLPCGCTVCPCPTYCGCSICPCPQSHTYQFGSNWLHYHESDEDEEEEDDY